MRASPQPQHAREKYLAAFVDTSQPFKEALVPQEHSCPCCPKGMILLHTATLISLSALENSCPLVSRTGRFVWWEASKKGWGKTWSFSITRFSCLGLSIPGRHPKIGANVGRAVRGTQPGAPKSAHRLWPGSPFLLPGEDPRTIWKRGLAEGGMGFSMSFPLDCWGGVGGFSLDIVSIIEKYQPHSNGSKGGERGKGI